MASHARPIRSYATGVQKLFNGGSTCVCRLLYDTMKQQISGGAEIFQPNNSFSRAAQPDTGVTPACSGGARHTLLSL